jgi:hypothetical protein
MGRSLGIPPDACDEWREIYILAGERKEQKSTYPRVVNCAFEAAYLSIRDYPRIPETRALILLAIYPTDKLMAVVQGIRRSINSCADRRYAYAGTGIACPEYSVFREPRERILEKIRIGGIVGMGNYALWFTFDTSVGSPDISDIFSHFLASCCCSVYNSLSRISTSAWLPCG